MKSMRHFSGLSMKHRTFDRVDVQLSMSLNLLAGYKEAFSTLVFQAQRERVSKCPMHLAGVGGYVIEGVLGVHCASAEAEGGGDTSVQEQRRKAAGQSRRVQRKNEVVSKVSMSHFSLFWITLFTALIQSLHKTNFLLLPDYLELIQLLKIKIILHTFLSYKFSWPPPPPPSLLWCKL